MKEIRVNIPEECKKVIVKMDGEQSIISFEMEEEKFEPKAGDIISYIHGRKNSNIGIFGGYSGYKLNGYEIYWDYATIDGEIREITLRKE